MQGRYYALFMDEIPRYAADPLLEFLAYMRRSARFLESSIRGVSMLRAMPSTITVLNKWDPLRHSVEEIARRKREYDEQIGPARQEAQFAETECREGFPLLHAQSLVGMWGAFEAAIEDSLVGILLNESALLRREPFARIRVSLAEFETLEKDERMRLLVNEISRGAGVGTNQGVDSFERILGCIGLSGAVDALVKQTLWEAHHVRNVIVHRNSLADRRLVEGCPWLDLKVGEKVKVTHVALHGYSEALSEYLLAIIRRLGTKYDVDIDRLIEAANHKGHAGPI